MVDHKVKIANGQRFPPPIVTLSAGCAWFVAR